MGTNNSAVPSRSVSDIWAEYRKNEVKAEALRNQLMEHYLYLVRYNAERIHVKLPEEVELDDLISAGVFGLMDAIKAFDPERGVKFETYCAPRIRGAILDELRAMDWVPRLTRSRANKLDSAKKHLQTELGRDPTPEEIQKRLKVSPEEYEKIVGDSGGVSLVSLSRKWFETDSSKDVREIDMLVDGETPDAGYDTRRKDLREAITRGLDRVSKLVICLYHFEGYRMSEVGQMLFMSESRISQVHDAAIAQIKAKQALRDLYKAG